MEDSLQDVENLLTDLDKDVIGAKYLTMENSVSFSEMCSYVVELPISEYLRPEVKLAKKSEVKNLLDYNPSRRLKIRDKKPSEVDGL